MKSPSKENLLQVFQESSNIHAVAERFGVSWSTVRCWLRWKEIDFRPSKNILLEDCIQLTDKEIGAKYKVTDKTICKWKKEYDISKKIMRSNSIPQFLTDIQRDLVTGKLLGDSWIDKVRSNCGNTCFSVEQCAKHEEYVIGVHKIMLPFSLPIRYRTRKNIFNLKSHHKKEIHTCLFHTKQCPIFAELRTKWYPNGVKIVPDDIELTWGTLAFWYCDDGSNQLGKRCIRHHGVLCTNGFTEQDVDILISKIKEKNIECHVTFNYGNPIIQLDKNTFGKFVENIKPHIPWQCMQYKLNVI